MSLIKQAYVSVRAASAKADTVGWSWQEAHTVILAKGHATRTMSVWEYVT
ncbi:hypothetical protein [Moorena sp. SIO4G3]|nr:hypothetical protein [Moorena sp. SIO4G3]NEO76212.1 hypothetical protein [Moorena sp. SIO4G3]